VPQNPKDEPARVLLEQLVNNGHIAKQKRKIPENRFSSESLLIQLPFKLPVGWEEICLGEIFELVNGYAFPSPAYVSESNNQVIRLGNVKNNRIMLAQNPAFIPDSLAESAEEFLIRENDLLITMTGTKAKRD
jgi:type I restriction enzyme, S subunit